MLCTSFTNTLSFPYVDDNPRSCDYPQTLSTSGSFAQCCPESGSCPFYTACSSNTLLAAGSASAVPCDVDPGLTCNTAVLATTAGASGGASYLACWQKSLGEGAFTFVQDIGSAGKSFFLSSSINSIHLETAKKTNHDISYPLQTAVAEKCCHADITISRLFHDTQDGWQCRVTRAFQAEALFLLMLTVAFLFSSSGSNGGFIDGIQ
jgi:hypothetical protein